MTREAGARSAAAARRTEARFAEALAKQQAGALAEAERLYRALVDAEPDHGEALHNLGVVLAQSGRLDEAEALLRRTVAVNPDHGSAHNNLGIVLRRLNRLDEAVTHYQRALELQPALDEVRGNLGLALRALGRAREAVPHLRLAADHRPKSAEAHLNLGNALKDCGELDAAIDAYRAALDLKPNYVEALTNLGSALRECGRHAEAEAMLTLALADRPDHVEAHFNRGNLLNDMGRHDEAVAAYRDALRLDAAHVGAHWNLANLLLMLGHYETGLDEFEWRWRVPAMGAHGFSGPQWDLKAKPETHVVIHAEQGFGDALQFARYVPLVAARGHRVTFRVPAPLQRLLSQLPRVEVVSALPEGLRADYHCPLLSLPRAFDTRLGTIPAEIPYLAADEAAVRRFRARLSNRGLKVGLVWRGNPSQTNDRNRSFDPVHLKPLFDLPGVRLVSLQKEMAEGDLDILRRFGPLEAWTSALADFADTAALVSALDLVITVCTSVAHLSGALGRPTWVLLAHRADWRWLLGRDDSPWYPTARLFRQSSRGDWGGVVTGVAQALQERLRQS